jgi:serine/threonine protein kinase
VPLAPGTRLGVYEVVGPLGSGGMGEVYRARDTRLQREVALKVLPELLAADAEHVARLEREARLLAALSHPNIAAIHGLDESNGVRALVLELVEGPTLAERLRRGPFALDETLRIALQLVDALETAHASGIVHRDLKPSNIKLRPDGAIKVLDFGLAKALESGRASTDVAESPTITAVGATRQGTILGTAAYMSPEQARGHAVDKRADIWAFGCVLYEMLTGRRAFAGKDVSETLAFVIMKEPDWTALPADAPPPIRRLLRRALEKDHRRRLADVSDARLELEDAGRKQSDVSVDSAASPLRRRERLMWILAVAVLSVLTIAAGVRALRPDRQPAEMRVDIATPTSSDPVSFAISPDGQKIVFLATTDGGSQLWLRYLNSQSAQPLPGTEDARLPFWSPDSRSIGFGSDAQLKRIDLDGGSVRGLASAPVFLGGTWNQAGDILFVPNANVGVFRVSASGGEVVPATRIEAGQSNHSPSFLPDGRHFLYYMTGAAAFRGVHVAELGKDGTRRLLDADTGGLYGPGDVVLFTRRSTAYAQRLDRSRIELVGEPVAIAQNVAVSPFANSLHAGLSAAAAGPVVYRAGQVAPREPIQFAWFDRSGTEILKVGDPLPMVLNAALAPDEQRIAAFVSADIWMLDMRRARAFSRFTFDATVEFTAIWSPDGTRLVISSNRAGQYDLYEKSASGAGTEKELLVTEQHKDATDWSLDGAFLLYRSFDPRRAYDILALRLEDRKSFPLVQTDADERNAQFSPDGKWIAYQSNESGRFEIWVQPFSVPGNERRGKWQISARGGGQVRWNRNGRELYYLSPDGRLMAAPIRFTADGNAIEPSTPQVLFRWIGTDLGRQGTALAPYAVSKDGQRFLYGTTKVQPNTSPLTMILNWRRP